MTTQTVTMEMDARLYRVMREAADRMVADAGLPPMSDAMIAEVCVLRGLQASGANDLLRAAGVPGDHMTEEPRGYRGGVAGASKPRSKGGTR